MQGMSLWLILDISFMMLSICLGYFCTLACSLTLVGTWMNLNPWDCNSLTSWAISTSSSLYTMVVEDKEAQNSSNISFGKFYIKIYDCHFGYTSALPSKANSCRKINSKSKVVLPTLDELHQPWATHTSSTTWSRSTQPSKVCYSILEKLYSKSWGKATQQDVNTSRCLNEKW